MNHPTHSQTRLRTVLTITLVIGAILLHVPRAHAAASLNISGGALSYSAGGYITNVVTISLASGSYTIQDTGETISLGGGASAAGCTGSGTNIVTCPDAAISSLQFILGDLDDTLTVNSTSDAMTVDAGSGNDAVTFVTPAVTVGGTLIGGSGNDTLTGGNGVDTLSGDAGNDTLVGVKGDDIMFGGTGNDLLVWNNGDNSDAIEGQDGADRVQVNGAPAAGDAFTIAPNGARVDFDRTNLVPFSLDIGTTEALELNGLGGDDVMTGTIGLAPLILIAMNGGDGSDTLLGGDGVDTMNGGAGNDTLVGAKGNDGMTGGTGDDLLVWNNGDNSDTMNGEDGADRVQVNGAPAAGDAFTIAPNGTRVRFDRTNLVPFSLDIGTTERLEVNGLGADDTFGVKALPGTTVVVDGGPHSVGDALTLDAEGQSVSSSGGTILVTGRHPVTHTNVESLTIANAGFRIFLPLVIRSGY